MSRALFLLFFVLAFSGVAQACNDDNVMKTHPAVFKATALATDGQTTTFRMIEPYKGNVGALDAEVKLLHPASTTFVKDDIYVVFATKDAQGLLALPQDCPLAFKAGTIPTDGLIFSELKIYSHQSAYLGTLIHEFPDNPYLYLERAAFHEKYAEFKAAAEDYRTGLEKVTGKSLSDALNATEPAAAPFIEGYNRVGKPAP